MQAQISNITKRILTCVKEHTDPLECSSLISSFDVMKLKKFRLVDALEQRLVESSIFEEYMTLSYVWGSSQSFRLCKDNLALLMSMGSLGILRAKLPRTISDAIALVHLLGGRYIWIDSLCLVEDDPEDMMNGIESMDNIYEMSRLTIVAANGDNADAGLPRVHAGSYPTSQIIEEVLPGIRLAVVQNLEKFLRKSKYYSRGWT
jgi:hypothetical protein